MHRKKQIVMVQSIQATGFVDTPQIFLKVLRHIVYIFAYLSTIYLISNIQNLGLTHLGTQK